MNDTIAGEVASYATAVRAACADLPGPDRELLLEDLEDHLQEVAAEAGGPLEERLGRPEAYAAEL
ncbi:MAG: HAAS signaling domain-containing protein, partial [Thermoleophilia bacterium]